MILLLWYIVCTIIYMPQLAILLCKYEDFEHGIIQIRNLYQRSCIVIYTDILHVPGIRLGGVLLLKLSPTYMCS